MLEGFLQQDETGNLNTIPSVSETQKKDINCHKFVLYAIGRISFDELISDSKAQREAGLDFTFGKKAAEISREAFVPIANPRELRTLANQVCKVDVVYIGQIQNAESDEMAHSFLLERLADGAYKCLDKAGFKYPFGVYELEDLFKYGNYHDQKWRFVPLMDMGEIIQKQGEDDRTYVYHGSHDLLEEGLPRQHRRSRYQGEELKTIFDDISFHATPYRWIALAYTHGGKSYFEFEGERIYYNMGVSLYKNNNEVVVYGFNTLEESLEKLYGEGGYVQVFDAKDFKTLPGLGDLEVVSQVPVKPVRIDRVEDPVREMRALKVSFIFQDLSRPELADSRNLVTRKE